MIFLRRVGQQKLEPAANDGAYVDRYDAVMNAFDLYMHPEQTWYARTYPELKDRLIAYFSAEFGLHESLPIYSGGLGVLAGDHCKAASDLGLPFVGGRLPLPAGLFPAAHRQRRAGSRRSTRSSTSPTCRPRRR